MKSTSINYAWVNILHAQLMPAALCCAAGVALGQEGQEHLSLRSPEPPQQHPPGQGTPLLSSQALPAITPLLPLLPMSRVIPILGEFL